MNEILTEWQKAINSKFLVDPNTIGILKKVNLREYLGFNGEIEIGFEINNGYYLSDPDDQLVYFRVEEKIKKSKFKLLNEIS